MCVCGEGEGEGLTWKTAELCVVWLCLCCMFLSPENEALFKSLPAHSKGLGVYFKHAALCGSISAAGHLETLNTPTKPNSFSLYLSPSFSCYLSHLLPLSVSIFFFFSLFFYVDPSSLSPSFSLSLSLSPSLSFSLPLFLFLSLS